VLIFNYFQNAGHLVDASAPYTEDLGAIFLKFRADLVIERDLVAANRAPVGRVKRKNDPLAS